MGAGIVYRLQHRGLIPDKDKIFLFSTTSRRLCGQHSLMYNSYLGSLSPGIKLRGREADHSLPSCAEVKNGEARPPLPHMPSWHSNSYSSSAYMD
jgi:hypothetical protein